MCPEAAVLTVAAPDQAGPITFDTAPERYRHWRLDVNGRVATLTLDVDEDAGVRPGYKLKLNSYDLGVDIEFRDALDRIRFEHPEVACVVITSAKDRMFCAGANIYMLGTSSHAWKVNFCKFTNETRNGMEDSSRHDGLRFLAAVNGACAGGGYEIALACDEILMIDDRSTTVSLPEVPLLGVLPGTGGLTRWSTSARSVATAPTSSAPTPTACAPNGRSHGDSSTPSLRRPIFPRSCSRAQPARPRVRRATRTRKGSSCIRCSARSTPAATTTATSTSRSTRTRAPRRSPYARRTNRSRRASTASSPRAMRGGRWQWRASSTTRC
jgi:hypothetical protein